MDAPLVGTPRQNYSFFYTASISAILSVIVLFVITGYTAVYYTHLRAPRDLSTSRMPSSA